MTRIKDCWIATCALAGALVLYTNAAVAAPCAAAPPPPPPLTPDWYNALILVDISGSMGEPHATSPAPVTKLQEALNRARDHVLELQARGKPVNYALWAFDTASPSPSFVRRIIDFPAFASGSNVLNQLGFDALGNPTPATRNPIFTPGAATPLATAACFAVGQAAANFDPVGNVISPGFQWGAMTGGRLAIIQREIYILSDALENATPAGTECAGATSASTDYLCYEPGTWQYALRNKLQTGNALNASLATANTGLIFNVDYLFTNPITTAVMAQPTRMFEVGTNATSITNAEPTLAQADTLFGGLAKMTRGTYRTVTVNALGRSVARRPGDVNLSGCVDTADYNQIAQFYGKTCSLRDAACLAADLNGDKLVDFSDYLIWTRNLGAGC